MMTHPIRMTTSQKTNSTVWTRTAIVLVYALGLAAPLFAQAGGALDLPRPTWWDNSGHPLAGGSVTSYACGTTNAQNFYSDSALSVPLPNPMTLNSAGRAQTGGSVETTVYLAALCYKFLVKDSTGATVYQQDNYYPQNYLGSGSFGNTVFLRGDATSGYTWSRIVTVVSTTVVGTQSGAWVTLTGDTVIRANNASLLTVAGLPAGYDGQRVWLVSVGAGQVDLQHQSSNEGTLANRLINFATSGTSSLAAGVGTALYTYDGTTSRWRLVAHEQGDFIEYGASATVTGFSAFTAQLARYKLRGRELQFILDIAGTSNATTLTFNLPSTFTTNASLTQQQGLVKGLDSGAAANAEYSIGVGASTVSMFKDAAGTAWTNSGTKQVSGSFVLQIQ